MSAENAAFTGVLSPNDVTVSIKIYEGQTIVTDNNGDILACATHNGARLNLQNPQNPENLAIIFDTNDESAVPVAKLDTLGELRGANPHHLKGNIQENVLPDGTVELIFADGNNHFQLRGAVPEDLTSQAVALATGLVGAEMITA